MKAGFIESHIARGNRNLLLFGLGLIVIGGGLTALFRHWFPALLILFGVVVLGMRLKDILNPGAHSIYQQLACYGNPEQLAKEVNREFAGVRPDDKWHFGNSWLASGQTYGVDLMPWSQIAWLYLESRVPSRSRTRWYYIEVRSRQTTRFHILAGTVQETATQLLQQLHARAPWAEVGFSEELEQQWTKHRSEFIERVEARMKVPSPTLQTW